MLSLKVPVGSWEASTMMEELGIPIWLRSMMGIERSCLSVQKQMKAILEVFSPLQLPANYASRNLRINYRFSWVEWLPYWEVKRVKNALSKLLKDAQLLHMCIQKRGASCGALEILLAEIKSATAALARREMFSVRIPEPDWELFGFDFTPEMALFRDGEFDQTRRALHLLSITKVPWKKFKEEAQVYAVVVSAVALLSLVYHYLAGYIDKGGSKTYSPGSLEFRSTYVSILLFRGACVWIKFRDAPSSKRGGYRRPVTDKLSGVIKRSDKPEARYKPPRESGNDNYIYLGVCATDEEAEVKRKVAAFYYGRNIGRLDFDDGRSFSIPPLPEEQEQGLSVEEKRVCVKNKVKEVYEHIKASIDTNTVRLVEQIHAHRCSSLPALKIGPVSEGPSDVAIEPEVIVEGHLPLPEEDIDAGFCKFLEDYILDSSEAMPDLPDTEPQQHLQDNHHVQDWVMAMLTFDNQCDNSLDIEPLGTEGSESILNHVHGSSEVAAGGLTNEDAPYNPQAVSEFPTMSSGGLQQHSDAEAVMPDMVIPSAINEDAPYNPQAVSEFPTMSSGGLQQHSDAEAVMPDMVIPSAINLCPGNSTSDQLALEVISLLVQQIKEKDKRIVELERENERLRGASQS